MRKSRRTTARRSVHRRGGAVEKRSQGDQGQNAGNRSNLGEQVSGRRNKAQALTHESKPEVQHNHDNPVLRQSVEPEGKTQKALKALTREQANALGERIEHLLANEMQYITSWYVKRYKNAALAALGWSEDDLTQNIRIQIWKGLATFDSSKKFKLETYLSSILEKYFASLAKRCRSAFKHKLVSMNDMIGDTYDSHIVGHEESDITWIRDQLYRIQYASESKGPEDLVYQSKRVEEFFKRLTDLELLILQEHVIGGKSLPTIAKETNTPLNRVTRTIKDVRIELRHYLRLEEDDGDFI